MSKRGRPYASEPKSKVNGDASLPNSSISNNTIRSSNRSSNQFRNNQLGSSETKNSSEFTSQEKVSRFNRNRYHPLSSTKASATATTPVSTTAEPSSAKKSESAELDVKSRLAALTNRFQTRTSLASSSNSSNRLNKLQRAPLASTRASNTPVDVADSSVKKINVTHNGSSSRESGSNEAVERSAKPAINPKLYESLYQRGKARELQAVTKEMVKPVTEANQSAESEPALEEEYDEDAEYENEEEPAAEEPEKKIAKPVKEAPMILTSNFFLPGKPKPQSGDDPAADELVDEEIEEISEAESHGDYERPKKESADDDAANAEEAVDEPTKETAKSDSAKDAKAVDNLDDVVYEYEYEDYVDETSTVSVSTTSTTTAAPAITVAELPATAAVEEAETVANTESIEETTTAAARTDYQEEARESDLAASTTASVPNAADAGTSETLEATTPVPDASESLSNSTESYVVVASVQTSRSISGARFLPFPQVEQEEKKQSLAELEKEEESIREEDDDLSIYKDSEASATTGPLEADDESETTTEDSTETVTKPRFSTVGEKLAHLREHLSHVEATTKGVPVVIRKFLLRTTAKPSVGVTLKTASSSRNGDSDPNPPVAFKPRQHAPYKSKNFAASHADAEEKSENRETNEATTASEPEELKQSAATKAPFKLITVTEDISKFLPPGFKLTTEKAPSSSEEKIADNISKFLPPDYKLRTTTESSATTQKLPATILDDISKFLPPGFKLKPSAKESELPKIAISEEISKFLPPGFKPNDTATPTIPTTSAPEPDADSILNKIKFSADVSSLLPPGFNLSEPVAEPKKVAPATASGADSSSFKIVFPKGIGKRTSTTPKPRRFGGPPPPAIKIRKGMPTRYDRQHGGHCDCASIDGFVSFQASHRVHRVADRINDAVLDREAARAAGSAGDRHLGDSGTDIDDHNHDHDDHIDHHDHHDAADGAGALSRPMRSRRNDKNCRRRQMETGIARPQHGRMEEFGARNRNSGTSRNDLEQLFSFERAYPTRRRDRRSRINITKRIRVNVNDHFRFDISLFLLILAAAEQCLQSSRSLEQMVQEGSHRQLQQGQRAGRLLCRTGEHSERHQHAGDKANVPQRADHGAGVCRVGRQRNRRRSICQRRRRRAQFGRLASETAENQGILPHGQIRSRPGRHRLHW